MLFLIVTHLVITWNHKDRLVFPWIHHWESMQPKVLPGILASSCVFRHQIEKYEQIKLDQKDPKY